jgi:diguanylate cyclase (GGDEF)-like protein
VPLSKLKSHFSVPTDQPELVQAQMRAFSRQVPLLYSVLLANMMFLASTHFSSAPLWLVSVYPLIFFFLALVRMIKWWKGRNVQFSAEESVSRLNSTIVLSAVFGATNAAWSIALLPYGNDLQHGHVAFFMGVTLVACVFCLMHVRTAAYLLTVVVTVPFAIRFGMLHNEVMLAIAANLVLVACAMLYIVSTHYDEFTAMVQHRVSLERKHEETLRLSSENLRLANRDVLTDLPNRRSFITLIEQHLVPYGLTGRQQPFAIGLIDLDGFKAVNDLYGHAAGDALLIAASTRLKALENNEATFVRLGGDEFGFITKNVDAAATLGNHVCAALAKDYHYDGITLQVTASCGIALYPHSCSSTSELLEYSDYALYEAKEKNTGEALIFTASHRQQLLAIHKTDQALRQANLATEMQLHYQPVVASDSGHIAGLEALARWTNPEIGSVPPSQFIATAERSGLIHKVTTALMSHLLRDMAQLPSDVHVSFNLSAKTLANPGAMLRLLAMIQDSGVDPKRLEFEITETALVANFEIVMSALQMLRNLGASIALDDFGTGYSSLSYVHQLPLDKIKIDRRFVNDVCTDKRARKVVKTVVGLSRDLGINCVAEGVETAEQAAVLFDIGCPQMQGYHFSRPMPLIDIKAWIERDSQLTQSA